MGGSSQVFSGAGWRGQESAPRCCQSNWCSTAPETAAHHTGAQAWLWPLPTCFSPSHPSTPHLTPPPEAKHFKGKSSTQPHQMTPPTPSPHKAAIKPGPTPLCYFLLHNSLQPTAFLSVRCWGRGWRGEEKGVLLPAMTAFAALGGSGEGVVMGGVFLSPSKAAPLPSCSQSQRGVYLGKVPDGCAGSRGWPVHAVLFWGWLGGCWYGTVHFNSRCFYRAHKKGCCIYNRAGGGCAHFGFGRPRARFCSHVPVHQELSH